jgi:hypothetical protein
VHDRVGPEPQGLQVEKNSIHQGMHAKCDDAVSARAGMKCAVQRGNKGDKGTGSVGSRKEARMTTKILSEHSEPGADITSDAHTV